jgi:hypothetical protein
LQHPTDVETLWVDALCIDQANIKERNAQVAKMADIYRNARSVRVWLGEAEDFSELAFAFINRVVDVPHLDQLVKDGATVNKWHALTNTWFSRRWVVQELALAQRSSIQYSNDIVEREKFANAIGLFDMIFDDIVQLFIDSRMLQGEIERNASAESHHFGEDELSSAGNAGWIGWSFGQCLSMEYSYLQPIWGKIKFGWRGTLDLLLCGFLKHIRLILSADAASWFVILSKSLLRAPRGKRIRPGQYSLSRLAFSCVLLWATPAASELSAKGNIDSAAKVCASSTIGNLQHEVENFFHVSFSSVA